MVCHTPPVGTLAWRSAAALVNVNSGSMLDCMERSNWIVATKLLVAGTGEPKFAVAETTSGRMLVASYSATKLMLVGSVVEKFFVNAAALVKMALFSLHCLKV